MADAQNRLVKILESMVGGFTPASTLEKTTLNTDTTYVLSTLEKTNIIKTISSMEPERKQTGVDSYNKYIKPLTHKIAQLKLDNDTILTLSPEVRAAETIIIPSIMSPTDLKDGEISLSSNSSLVDIETNNRITALLNDYFNKKWGLSTKLLDWIKEALYGAGSKPILVLPITELDTIINDPTAIQYTVTETYATESLDYKRIVDIKNIESQSVMGIADVFHRDKTEVSLEELLPSFTTAIDNFVKETKAAETNNKDKNGSSYNFTEKKSKTTEVQNAFKKFRDEVLRDISIVDNPDIIKSDKAKKTAKQKEINQRIVNHYKTKTLINFQDEQKDSVGNPLVYELPPESVIPIFTPGTPTDHIGYFIAVDEFGNPIHVNMTESRNNVGVNKQLSADNLYKSFGLDSYLNSEGSYVVSYKTQQDTLMTDIYESIVEQHLKTRLENSGLTNSYIGAAESVYRCMFSRYLSARKTKLLFVPKSFMTYFCFKYNDDGTGRSQIEDVKFILSLKITLMICRMMSAMNSAVDRKTISATFDERMGDPIQFIELLKKEAINKSIVNFSYDVSDVTRSLAEKAITVKARGMPGAENFEISQESTPVASVIPDTALAEDLSNLLCLQLDTPPSALNILNENEYSKSVATNNLFFSRRTSIKQKISCKHTEKFVKSYVSMSEILKSDIKDILQQGKKDKDNKKEDGVVDDDKKSSIDVILNDIISNIEAKLPSPNIAPNKTEFEELDTMIQSISTAIEAVFDNDIASDEPMVAMRAIIKSDIVREFMSNMGVSKDLQVPDLTPEVYSRILDYKTKLVNLKAGMEAASKKTDNSNVTSDDSSTGGSDDSSF